MPRFRLLVLTLLIAVTPVTAFANPWLLAPGEWYTEAGGMYYKADTYRDNDGNRVAIPSGGILERRTGLSYSEFGWHPKLGVLIGIPFTSVTRRTADNQFQATETGLSDLLIGAKYALANDETAMSLQVDAVLPMGYNRSFYPSLGAGSQSVSARILGGRTLPGASGWFEGGIGYQMTFGRAYVEDDSGLVAREAKTLGAVVANAAAGFWIGPSFLVAGEYRGRLSMETIPDGAPGYNDDMQSAHLIGPRFTYRVDDHIDLTVGSMHTAAGKRAVHADRYYVAVAVKQSGLNRLRGFLGNKQQP